VVEPVAVSQRQESTVSELDRHVTVGLRNIDLDQIVVALEETGHTEVAEQSERLQREVSIESLKVENWAVRPVGLRDQKDARQKALSRKRGLDDA